MGIIQKLSVFFGGAEKETAVPTQSMEPAVVVAEPSNGIAVAPISAPEPPPRSPLSEGETGTGAPRAKKVVLADAGLTILDLRELPSSRFRIVGSSFWVTDSGRYKHGGSDYLLVREPKNKWDENAVAVYGKGRKVGHLSEAKAAALAPILDQLTFDAYRVGGAPPARDSIRMWVDIPAIPKLRAFIKGLTERQPASD